jgi:hypothetical protein
VLKRCGDDLSRDNVMRQATGLKGRLPMLLPGIEVNTSATDHAPLEQMRMMQFSGGRWEHIGAGAQRDRSRRGERRVQGDPPPVNRGHG